MKAYEVVYEVVNSGAGIVKEVVQAASDYNARRLVEAKFPGRTVRIIQVNSVQ